MHRASPKSSDEHPQGGASSRLAGYAVPFMATVAVALVVGLLSAWFMSSSRLSARYGLSEANPNPCLESDDTLCEYGDGGTTGGGGGLPSPTVSSTNCTAPKYDYPATCTVSITGDITLLTGVVLTFGSESSTTNPAWAAAKQAKVDGKYDYTFTTSHTLKQTEQLKGAAEKGAGVWALGAATTVTPLPQPAITGFTCDPITATGQRATCGLTISDGSSTASGAVITDEASKTAGSTNPTWLAAKQAVSGAGTKSFTTNFDITTSTKLVPALEYTRYNLTTKTPEAVWIYGAAVTVTPPAGPSTAVCTGTAPTNATLCTGDNTGLVANTPLSLVASCSAAKCEYTCSAGFVLNTDGTACIASGGSGTPPTVSSVSCKGPGNAALPLPETGGAVTCSVGIAGDLTKAIKVQLTTSGSGTVLWDIGEPVAVGSSATMSLTTKVPILKTTPIYAAMERYSAAGSAEWTFSAPQTISVTKATSLSQPASLTAGCMVGSTISPTCSVASPTLSYQFPRPAGFSACTGNVFYQLKLRNGTTVIDTREISRALTETQDPVYDYFTVPTQLANSDATHVYIPSVVASCTSGSFTATPVNGPEVKIQAQGGGNTVTIRDFQCSSTVPSAPPVYSTGISVTTGGSFTCRATTNFVTATHKVKLRKTGGDCAFATSPIIEGEVTNQTITRIIKTGDAETSCLSDGGSSQTHHIIAVITDAAGNEITSPTNEVQLTMTKGAVTTCAAATPSCTTVGALSCGTVDTTGRTSPWSRCTALSPTLSCSQPIGACNAYQYCDPASPAGSGAQPCKSINYSLDFTRTSSGTLDTTKTKADFTTNVLSYSLDVGAFDGGTIGNPFGATRCVGTWIEADGVSVEASKKASTVAGGATTTSGTIAIPPTATSISLKTRGYWTQTAADCSVAKTINGGAASGTVGEVDALLAQAYTRAGGVQPSLGVSCTTTAGFFADGNTAKVTIGNDSTAPKKVRIVKGYYGSGTFVGQLFRASTATAPDVLDVPLNFTNNGVPEASSNPNWQVLTFKAFDENGLLLSTVAPVTCSVNLQNRRAYELTVVDAQGKNLCSVLTEQPTLLATGSTPVVTNRVDTGSPAATTGVKSIKAELCAMDGTGCTNVTGTPAPTRVVAADQFSVSFNNHQLTALALTSTTKAVVFTVTGDNPITRVDNTTLMQKTCYVKATAGDGGGGGGGGGGGCVPNSTCNGTAPQCGSSNTGTDNCGNTCRLTGGTCPTNQTCTNNVCTAATPVCGDASVSGNTEQCDDGNTTSGDGCSASCKLEAPTGVACPASGISSTSIRGTWTANSGVAGYTVSLLRDAVSVATAEELKTANSHDFSGLTADTDYIFRVAAKGAGTPAPVGPSAEVTCHTKPPLTLSQTLTAIPATIDANGTATSTLTAKLYNYPPLAGKPAADLSGYTITFSRSASSTGTLITTSGVTDAAGMVSVQVRAPSEEGLGDFTSNEATKDTSATAQVLYKNAGSATVTAALTIPLEARLDAPGGLHGTHKTSTLRITVSGDGITTITKENQQTNDAGQITFDLTGLTIADGTKLQIAMKTNQHLQRVITGTVKNRGLVVNLGNPGTFTEVAGKPLKGKYFLPAGDTEGTGGALHDNKVSHFDLTAWIASFRKEDAASLVNDLDGNGSVGAEDLSLIIRNFNSTGDSPL